MVSLFALTTLVAPTISVANLFAGILLLAIAMYASYVIYLKNMHPWFVWIAYLNPAMYAMEAILSNELYNLKLDCSETIVPRGPTYDDVPFSHKACAWQGATLGNDYVRGRDYLKQGLSYTYHHVWRNFGIIIGFLVFFIACTLFASQYIKPYFNKDEIERNNSRLTRWLPFLNKKRGTRSSARNDSKYAGIPKSHSVSSSSSSLSAVPYQVSPSNKEMALNDYNEQPITETVETQKHIISWKISTTQLVQRN